MRQYELMVILTSETDPTDGKKIDGIIAKMLGDEKKALKEIVVIGKKRLAYPIEKHNEGIYVLAKLAAASIKVGQIEKSVKLMPEVIRYLLTVAKE